MLKNKRVYLNITIFRQLAEQKEGKCLSEKYLSVSDKLLYECKNDHQWYAYPSNTLKGHWCTKCAATERAKITKDSIDTFKEIAKDKGGKCLTNTYNNQKDILSFECGKGHQWNTRAVNIKRGFWCTECNKFTKKNILRKTKISSIQKIKENKEYELCTKKINLCKELAILKKGFCLSETYGHL